MKIWCRTLAIIAMLASSSAAMAQQQLLHEPQPPSSSAYVRFVNALGASAQVVPGFADPQTLGITPEQRVGPYTLVENVAGRSFTVPVTEGMSAGTVQLTLKPGTFNTVIWLPSDNGPQAAVIEDAAQLNQLRTKLSFYNATGDCPAASLKLEPDGPTVFQDVPPAAARMRAVNPVAVTVRAQCGGFATKPFDLKGLEASRRVSIWMMVTAQGPLAFMTLDAIAPGKH